MRRDETDRHLRLVDKGIRVIKGEQDCDKALSTVDDGCSTIGTSLKSGTLSILIGAGLSSPCGIPNWPTLVRKLLISYLTENYDAPLPDLDRYIGSNPIIQIRILRRFYHLKSAFLADLREVLYAELAYPPTTPVLNRLARLAVQTYNGGRPLTLITYNFDDLLEAAIANIDDTVPVYPIFSPDQMIETQGGIRVYHPHGYLPRGDHTPDGCNVIFSEDEFHALMSDNCHWANVLQLYAFRHSTCVFVGTSLSDPNVRRLLDRAKHASSPPHWVVRALPMSTPNADWISRIISEEMESLGVRVLRLESYDDIPGLFERLTSAT